MAGVTKPGAGFGLDMTTRVAHAARWSPHLSIRNQFRELNLITWHLKKMRGFDGFA